MDQIDQLKICWICSRLEYSEWHRRRGRIGQKVQLGCVLCLIEEPEQRNIVKRKMSGHC